MQSRPASDRGEGESERNEGGVRVLPARRHERADIVIPVADQRVGRSLIGKKLVSDCADARGLVGQAGGVCREIPQLDSVKRVGALDAVLLREIGDRQVR